MKTIVTLIVVGAFAFGGGCTDKKAEAEKARQEAEAKARAEAAKKEMETLPKVFRNRNYLEKNEPPKEAAPNTEQSPQPKKP